MRNMWTAARSILAVLAGIVGLTTVAFAIEIPLRWVTLRFFSQTFPDQATLESNIGWMLGQWLYTIPALLLGGYIAAWLAPRRGLAHAVAMAIVQELLTVVLIFEPPHPVPPWMWAIALVVTPAAIICGGYIRSRPKTATRPAEQSPTLEPAAGEESNRTSSRRPR
jgi:hypothetical protein